MSDIHLKAVLFDMDGVVVDSEEIYYRAVKHAFQPWHDVIRQDFVDYWMLNGQPSSAGLIEKYGLPVTLEQIRERKSEKLAKLIDSELEMMPGAMHALEILGSRYPLGLVTSSGRNEMEMKLETTAFHQSTDWWPGWNLLCSRTTG